MNRVNFTCGLRARAFRMGRAPIRQGLEPGQKARLRAEGAK